MKVSHIATAILVSVVVILTGNLISSSYSAREYEELLGQKARIERNLEDLRATQSTLQGEIDLLQRSADSIRLEARSLGYYEPGEVVVRRGDGSPRSTVRSPGRIIRIVPRPEEHNRTAVIAAIAAFVLVLVGLALGSSRAQGVSRRASR